MNTFFSLDDGILKGKGITSIINSKVNRNSILYLFGGSDNIPSSVMKAKKEKVQKQQDEFVFNNNYSDSSARSRPLTKKFLKSGLRNKE